MLNGGPVSWKSTKQKCVSLSTAESEWYAASEAGKEIIYLRKILDDFGFGQKNPTTLHEPRDDGNAENVWFLRGCYPGG